MFAGRAACGCLNRKSELKTFADCPWVVADSAAGSAITVRWKIAAESQIKEEGPTVCGKTITPFQVAAVVV